MTASIETKPLTVWTCDSCGEDITLAEAGRALVVWRDDDQHRGYDFRIVHKNMDDRECDPTSDAGFVLHTELSMFLGAKGLAYAMGFLSDGPIMGGEPRMRVADLDSFVDLVRRVQTPWYEEARPFWNTEHTQHWLADASESFPYTPGVLERIAKQDLGQ